MGDGEWGNGYSDRQRSWGAPTPRPGEPAPGPWASDPADVWGTNGGGSSWGSAPPGEYRPTHSTGENPVVDPNRYYPPPRRTGPSPISGPPSPGRRPSLTSAVTGHLMPRANSHAAQPVLVPRAAQRRAEEADEPEEYEEDPAYGRVIIFTVTWFGAPTLLYLIWMLTLTGDRRSLAVHTFGSGLGWLIGAGVLSVVVSAILRWAVTGWRALTISFAGAVIGSGVATIAHSLAFSP